MDIPRLLDGRLKLRHLILVDALSEQGSVVGAAASLHVTQPVVTRGLHDLEAVLGVSLYDRGPRGITPTVFGDAFTDHARAVLAQLTQAARHVAEIADADRGTVVVGTHLAGSNLLLPRAIAALKGRHPLLSVIVREATPEVLLVDLEAGRLDVIVGRLTAPADDATVRHALYEESVRVVVGAHHPAVGEAGLTLPDLLAHPWILPGTETVLRRELEEFFVRAKLPLPENRVECTSFLTVRQLLIETDVVAVLPGLIGADDPRLTPLPISLDPIGHSVGITLPRNRPLSPSTRALLGTLRAAAAGLKADGAHHAEGTEPLAQA
ncbi:LysR substrate-binding domain-containing protein [Streptomyces sp. NPDC001787]|uniref:LysR substrate-binding domain-containing protein n=1 Tax=Streptomyces sp. NPDC001787 TaxID=3154523 RepID=UPI003316AFE5